MVAPSTVSSEIHFSTVRVCQLAKLATSGLSQGFVKVCLWDNSTTWRTRSHNLQMFNQVLSTCGHSQGPEIGM